MGIYSRCMYSGSEYENMIECDVVVCVGYIYILYIQYEYSEIHT